MRPREFIALLGSGIAGWPLAARTQQPAMPVVGFLNGASPEGYRPMVTAFRHGVQESGYVEGRNVAVEYRWAEGRTDRLLALAGAMENSAKSWRKGSTRTIYLPGDVVVRGNRTVAVTDAMPGSDGRKRREGKGSVNRFESKAKELIHDKLQRPYRRICKNRP